MFFLFFDFLNAINFLIIDFYYFFIFLGFLLFFFYFCFFQNNLLKLKFCLIYLIFFFFLNVVLFLLFDFGFKPFQIYISFYFISCSFFLDFGLDNISLLFLLLLSFIMPITLIVHYYWTFFFLLKKRNMIYLQKDLSCLIYLNSYFNNFLQKSNFYLFFLMLLNFCLIFFFFTLNLFFFYITLELSMIPLFFIIGWFGSRINRLKASYYLFFYTLLGSIPFFIGIILIYNLTGTLNFYFLYEFNFDLNLQVFFWILFFIPFATKVPMMPLHLWLPEAHVEAPTEGSILLAGLLLKLGVYGFLRFLIPIFPFGLSYFSSFFYTLSLLSLLYSSILIFSQVDLKKIIAYSSIAHMNFSLLGLFSGFSEGLLGSIFIFYTHGIVSSAIFLCIGCLYQRFYTRLLSYYSGLIYYYPIFGSFFFLYILGNLAFPGTGNFIGEFLVFLGVFSDSFLIGLVSLFSTFLCSIYSILLFSKIFFGIPSFYFINFSFKNQNNKQFIFWCKNYNFFFFIELQLLLFFFCFLVFSGIFSYCYLDFIKLFVFFLN